MNRHGTLVISLVALIVVALMAPLRASAGGGHSRSSHDRDHREGTATNSFQQPSNNSSNQPANRFNQPVNSLNQLRTNPANIGSSGTNPPNVGSAGTVRRLPNAGAVQNAGALQGATGPCGGGPCHAEQLGGVDPGKGTGPGASGGGRMSPQQVGGVDTGGFSPGGGGEAFGSNPVSTSPDTDMVEQTSGSGSDLTSRDTDVEETSTPNSTKSERATAAVKPQHPRHTKKVVTKVDAPTRVAVPDRNPFDRRVTGTISDRGDGILVTSESCFNSNFRVYSLKGLVDEDATILASIHCR